MLSRTIASITTLALLGSILGGPAPAAAQERTFRVGADVGFAPHVMAKATGGYEGFNVDLIEAVAARMKGKVEIVNIPYSGIFAALDARKIDFIIAPTTANPDFAGKSLVSEGYLSNNFQFITRKGAPPIEKLEDLKGKTISVNRGNSNDMWLTAREGEYGWKVLRVSSNPDALQAVISGQADATLSSGTVAKWTGIRNPGLQASYVVKTGFAYFHPFRNGDEALRDEFETALECLKLDGTVAKIYEKWFREPPAGDDAAIRAVMGYGEPGLKGYDSTPHAVSCAR
jgi:polar amino acid transport system substrate-binding protein